MSHGTFTASISAKCEKFLDGNPCELNLISLKHVSHFKYNNIKALFKQLFDCQSISDAASFACLHYTNVFLIQRYKIMDDHVDTHIRLLTLWSAVAAYRKTRYDSRKSTILSTDELTTFVIRGDIVEIKSRH